MPFVCLVPVRLFSVLQYDGITPHEWIAAKGQLPSFPSAENACHLTKSGLKRLAALFVYSQDIVDDYFPAHPAAKISSALHGYKGALTPLLERQSYM